MAIQQLDLGAVYDTLSRKRGQDLQERQFAQQGQLNALQMARYQREDAQEQRKQSALATYNDPAATPEQKQSALGVAFPELLAKHTFRDPKDSFVSLGDGTGLDLRDPNNTRIIGRDTSVLDGETTQVSAPQTAPRPTLAPGGHGPVPMPVERQPLGVQVAASESGGKGPGIVNKQGYSGKYQFGEAAATEAGFYEPDDNPNDNKWSGKFKGLSGVNSYQDFLGNEAAQDQAFTMHQTHLDTEIEGRGLNKYIGKTVGGVPVTRDALVGMMHIGGPSGTQKFLESDGKYNPGDSNGTRISDYGKKFAGGGAPEASQVDQHVTQVLGPELANKVFAAEKANPNALLTDVMPPEWVQQHPEAKGVTIAQRRQQIESSFASNAPQAPPQSGDEGFSRVRNLKAMGLPDAPTGMMWVGKPRANGKGYDTKVVPMPGAPDDRGDKQSAQIFDQETKLRTEHYNLTKSFDTVQNNYATMPELAADDSGGSDIALVNAFYKTFAPDEAVMEGEFATVAKAAGLPDRLVGIFEKAMHGDVLTGDQRQDLIKAAGRFYSQRKTSVEGANKRYADLAKSYPGVNADRVVMNPIRDIPKYEPKPKAETKVAEAEIPTFGSPTDAGLAALPSGAQFRDPNGVLRRKP